MKRGFFVVFGHIQPAVLSRQNDARKIAGAWLISRLYIFVIGLIGSWSSYQNAPWFSSFIQSWSHFDAFNYQTIAQLGYVTTGSTIAAFFPGLPLLMWVGGWFGFNALATGIVVSLVASLFAGVALGKLAKIYGANPSLTATVWFFAPMAVFLVAPYTEALFAALSFWSWYFAKSGNWILAGLLAGVSGLVRSNALFLGLALVLLFLVTKNKRWTDSWALLLPFLGVASYFCFLYWLTGSWTHWFDVQSQEWDRTFTNPVTSAINTVNLARDAIEQGLTPSGWIHELSVAFLSVALAIVMLFKRWWAESFYVVATMGSLMTSQFFLATPRAMLILFPVWLLLGLWVSRFRKLGIVYLAVSAMLLARVTLSFVDGQWIS